MMSTASQAVMNNHGGLFEEQDEMLPNLGFSIINSSVSADHMAMPMVSSSCHQESLIMFKGFNNNNNNNNVTNANMMMPPPPNTSNLTQALLVAAAASSQQIIKPPPSQHLNNIINLTAASSSSSSPPNSNNSSTLPPPPTHLLSLHTSALLLNPWGGWGDEVSDHQCLNSSGNKRSSSSSNNGGIGEIGVYGMKMRKIKGRRKMREPRFCFKTMSDVDVLDDGYKWRKYGQKVVKNTHHPRSYYRCTQDNCRVKKRVERLAEDPRMVITTYEGRHVHSPSNDLEDSQPSDSQLTNFLW